jgi:hypothetical protein
MMFNPRNVFCLQMPSLLAELYWTEACQAALRPGLFLFILWEYMTLLSSVHIWSVQEPRMVFIPCLRHIWCSALQQLW